MNLRDYLAVQQHLVDAELDRLTPPETTPPATIHRAMRYSLFAGGKRIRPVLCLEAAETRVEMLIRKEGKLTTEPFRPEKS